jgi:hypothetical protein
VPNTLNGHMVKLTFYSEMLKDRQQMASADFGGKEDLGNQAGFAAKGEKRPNSCKSSF